MRAVWVVGIALLCTTATAFVVPVNPKNNNALTTTKHVPEQQRVVLLAQRNSFDDVMNRIPFGAIAGGVALFAFPGLFLGLFNIFFVLFFIVPPLLGFGFQLWARFNILTAECPVCDAPVQGLKSNREAICFNCGANLIQTSDQSGWRLRYDDDDDYFDDNIRSDLANVIDVESETVS